MNFSPLPALRLITTRRVFSCLDAFALLCALFFFTSASQAQTTYPLGAIFSNKGAAGLSSVQANVQQQKTTAPVFKSNGVETREYDGYFQASSNTSKLAVLSDDGTSMSIDGNSVLGRAGQGQGFDEPNSTTFYPLSFAFQAGRVYHLHLTYTNTIHTSDADVDGLTLFAYDGGGNLVEPGVTQVYTAPGVAAEIMSGAMDDDDHTMVVYAKIAAAKAGVTVRFEVVDNSPSTTVASLSVAEATTDSEGIAQTVLKSSNTDAEGQKVTVKAWVQTDKSDVKQTQVELLIPGIEYSITEE